MKSIFDADNAFFRFMNRVADILILNLFFIITSIPIVTIGASYTALYYYCLKAVKNEEEYLWKSYWKSFKTNFVQGFLLEVIYAAAGVIIWVDLKFMYDKAFVGGGIGWRLLFFIMVGIALLVVLSFIYVFPILSRFDNTIIGTIRNSIFISLRHVGQTVPLIFILGTIVLGAWMFFPLTMFFAVALWVYLSSLLLVKVIDRYMPKEERHEDDYYLGAEAENVASDVGRDMVTDVEENLQEADTGSDEGRNTVTNVEENLRETDDTASDEARDTVAETADVAEDAMTDVVEDSADKKTEED